MKKEVKTSLLNISFEEHGNEHSPAIVLVHGFPDDAQTWNVVSEALVNAGYRTLAPYLRGYGDTRFLAGSTMRSAQYAALVSDLLDFTNALNLNSFLLVGHDWGSTVAHQFSALFPEKVLGLVALASSYNGKEPQQLSLQSIQAYWYQWLFNTAQGVTRLRDETKDFCKYLWKAWSPGWHFSGDELGATARSWENPDFVEIVIHSYRYRWKNASGDDRYEKLEKRFQDKPEIEVPTIFLQGDEDCASLPQASLNKERFYMDHYERRIVSGAGHFIQREKPAAVIEAIKDMATLANRLLPADPELPLA